jgi:hypothetical protein
MLFTSPERRDQIAHRAAKGSGGGRPPSFDPVIYAGDLLAVSAGLLVVCNSHIRYS